MDLKAYLQQLDHWASVEAETNRTIDRILRTQFVDESDVEHEINDSRAAITAHLTQIHNYAPRTSAVQRVHDRYIDAWQRLLDGYRAIDDGFATGDYSKLAGGREALFAWRAAIRDVAAELRALADETGVVPAPETAGARSTQAREAGPR